MEQEEILQYVVQTLLGCADYREVTELVRFWETDYLDVMGSLSEADRSVIEKYQEVCDLQSASVVVHAFHLGYKHGRLGNSQ